MRAVGSGLRAVPCPRRPTRISPSAELGSSGASNRRICYNSFVPDSPFDGKRASHKPLPQCKAFLICEDVEIDDATGQFDLYKLVNVLSFSKFPATVPSLVAFLQLYDGIGRYDLSLELRNLADDNSVSAGIFGHLEFPERLVKIEVALPIDSMRLPHPGRYELAVLLDAQELATQFIDVEIVYGDT